MPSRGITLQLAASTLVAPQNGTATSVPVTVTRPTGDTNSITLSAGSLPAGVTTVIDSPGAGNTGKVTLTAAGVPAGTYAVTVSASDGTTTATANLSLVVAVVAAVQSTINIAAGANGRLQSFLSTSFQPAEWDFTFFAQHPAATTPLDGLRPQHIRLQPVSGGTPQKVNQSWDFTDLDSILDPVIGVADKSPELQIAVAPDFMNDASGHLVAANFLFFAAYCANLVKYYNTTTGFTDASGNHVHSSSAASLTPITWWGIFNEPNINGLSATDYTNLYNMVVPAMQAAGSTVPIKFVAVELSDFGNEPQNYLPTFVSGVAAQVDAVATHYYSSCNQADPDAVLFDSISNLFVPHVKYIYSQLKSKPALANVPVWVTENNVNADFDAGRGISACNGTPFVLDRRGTSAFFAAWRPYVFSQLAQAGAHSLYHWDFNADAQFGEVDFGTANAYLSYWVDYTLARYFPYCPNPSPSCASTGSNILNLTTTESSTVETLATRNDDGSVVVMVANRAVHSPADNNGAGDPRTVIVDVAALGSFTSASQLTIDSGTDPTNGPTATPVTPASRMEVTLAGYGVSFLALKP